MKDKKIILMIFFIIIFLILGKNLNPFSSEFFTFHDETQPARIQQFVKELKAFHIPPRIAPDMNFGIGYPVFNFYAPAPYWIASIINLLGFSVINSLKISFLLALLIGFFGMYLFLTNFFGFLSSVLGGFFYITSLYFPISIFVRGNLGELWSLSLFPLTLYFIVKITKNKKIDKKIFLSEIFLLTLLFTSHNIFSLILIFLVIALIFLTKNNLKVNLIAFIFAILLSSYFWVPAIIELKNTWAKEVATLTKYQDHFLCPSQLWQSDWGFGGSTTGCRNDGMAFKIGKLQIIFFGLGIILFLINFFKSKNFKKEKLSLFIIVYSLLFLFLTTYQSAFVWKIFDPVFKLIQFPWRLIGPSLFGVAYFSTYFFENLKTPFKNGVIILFIFLTIIINQKYFVGQRISTVDFEKRYLSENYIKNKVAFKVAEYLPKNNDYFYWRSLEKKTPSKLEISKLTLSPFDKNRQTPVQKLGNGLTIVSFFILIILYKNNWILIKSDHQKNQ